MTQDIYLQHLARFTAFRL